MLCVGTAVRLARLDCEPAQSRSKSSTAADQQISTAAQQHGRGKAAAKQHSSATAAAHQHSSSGATQQEHNSSVAAQQLSSSTTGAQQQSSYQSSTAAAAEQRHRTAAPYSSRTAAAEQRGSKQNSKAAQQRSSSTEAVLTSASKPRSTLCLVCQLRLPRSAAVCVTRMRNNSSCIINTTAVVPQIQQYSYYCCVSQLDEHNTHLFTVSLLIAGAVNRRSPGPAAQ